MIEMIQDCAQEVFESLGSGHSETVYEAALAVELSLRDVVGPMTISRQVPCPIKYKSFTVGVGFIDILLNGYLIIELKTVKKLTELDEQQVRKYLTGTGLRQGLLLNFNPGAEEVEAIVVHSVECYINDDPKFGDHNCGGMNVEANSKKNRNSNGSLLCRCQGQCDSWCYNNPKDAAEGCFGPMAD